LLDREKQALLDAPLLCSAFAKQALRQVGVTITELEARGKPFTQKDLCEMVGKSRDVLRKYPRVNALLEQKLSRHHVYQRCRTEPAEEELVQRIKVALIDLSDHGEHITMKKVARKVNITDVVLMQYPQVVMLLEQYGYQKPKPRSEREEELLDLMREAIYVCQNNGLPMTKEKLSNMVGVDRATLLRYSQVRTFMTQAICEDKQERKERRFQVRQEYLTQQVVVALQQLRDQNRNVTKRAVEKLVHFSNICSRYPKVRVLIERAMQAQHTTIESTLG
jgi:hypothetical protein